MERHVQAQLDYLTRLLYQSKPCSVSDCQAILEHATTLMARTDQTSVLSEAVKGLVVAPALWHNDRLDDHITSLQVFECII